MLSDFIIIRFFLTGLLLTVGLKLLQGKCGKNQRNFTERSNKTCQEP